MGATVRTKWPDLGEVYSDTKEFRAAVLTVAWRNRSKMSVDRGGYRWTKMRCALFKENGKRCVFGMDVTQVPDHETDVRVSHVQLSHSCSVSQRSEARATAREFGRAHFARIGVNPPDETERHLTIGMSYAELFTLQNQGTGHYRNKSLEEAPERGCLPPCRFGKACCKATAIPRKTDRRVRKG